MTRPATPATPTGSAAATLSVHDDLDAILACGPGVRDRYQLRRAGTPNRRAEPARTSDVAHAVRHAAVSQARPVPVRQQ